MAIRRIIFDNKEEWLKHRTRIGGSDASCILGMNPWKTNNELWMEKTGQTTPNDISDKECVKYGVAAEPLLRELFALDFPEYEVEYFGDNMILNDDFPFGAASLDGELTEKEKQILFKNAQEQGIDLDEFEMVLEARLTELEKVKKDAAPKSNKYGDVRKCPACGSLVPAFKGVCQECGFEFANVDANLSSKQLAEKLLKESSENKKIENILRRAKKCLTLKFL